MTIPKDKHEEKYRNAALCKVTEMGYHSQNLQFYKNWRIDTLYFNPWLYFDNFFLIQLYLDTGKFTNIKYAIHR